MKRIISLIASTVCILTFTGCISRYFPTPISDRETIKEKIMAQEELASKHHLKQDEYYIYIDGKVDEKTKEYSNEQYNLKLLSENEYEGKVLETKRGISIGDEAWKLHHIYKDVPCIVLFNNGVYNTHLGIYNTFPKNPSQIIRGNNDSFFKTDINSIYVVRYNTYFIDNEYVQIEELQAILNKNGYDLFEELEHISVSGINVKILNFGVVDGVITNIIITHY